MKNKRIRLSKALHLAAALALMGALWVAVPPAHAGVTIPVNTINDVLGDEHCSLQEAVAAANTDTSQDSGACPAGSGTDTITFNIGAYGSSNIIDVGSTLDVTAPVVIEGRSQPGYAGIPLIEIRGSFNGLISIDVGGAGSSIKGLRFTNNYVGSYVSDLQLQADGVVVTACYFDTEGAGDYGGYSGGIWMSTSSNLIGGTDAADRNLFAGEFGIDVTAGSNNTIQGNYFGLTSGGNALLVGMNAHNPAIRIHPLGESTSNTNTIRNNVIAGYPIGIELQYPSHGNVIAGNYIGIGANGTTSLGNGVGVQVSGSYSNTIGGITAADRNVISGNTGSGNIVLTQYSGHNPDFNAIKGNYIGTTADGLSAVSPAITGVSVAYGDTNDIGGTFPGSGNLISGNQTGIMLNAGATGTTIFRNLIGTDATGMNALGNVVGISLSETSATIGESGKAGNNVISGQGTAGIRIINGSGTTTISGNRIGVSATGAAALPNYTGIKLENASAEIAQNWIANSTQYGVLIANGSTTTSNSTYNCFNANALAAFNSNTTDAPLQWNWWGSHTGPYNMTNNPTGTGDPVGNYVDFSSYLTLPAAACHIFSDVPVAGKEWMEPWVDAFYLQGITTGCGANPLTYCPENPVTRAAMAVFILRAIEGPTYTPPAAHGYFDDLPVAGKEWMEPWVDEFYDRGITTGCGTSPLRYCPENPVTRAAMAVFLLRALEGSSYVPDHTDHYFSDLPVTGKTWMEPFVDEFYERGITTGCGADPLTYCPENPVTRAAMAVFISRAYDLYP